MASGNLEDLRSRISGPSARSPGYERGKSRHRSRSRSRTVRRSGSRSRNRSKSRGEPSKRSKSGSRNVRSSSRDRKRSKSRSKTKHTGPKKKKQSRSRSPVRKARSRSCSFRLVRSPSRELYKETLDADKVTALVETQQEYVFNLIAEHKAEVEAKLQARQRKFQSKQIEKQFEINTNFKEKAEKVLTKIQTGELKRAEDLATELIQDLEKHSEDLVIADTSQFGWLAVAKVRAATELPKALRKRLEQVDKDLAAQKTKYGGPRRKVSQVSGAGAEPVIRRADKRLTPEEALFQAGKQLRQGTCSHCKKELHYYKECPAFWSKVQESRLAKAKEDGGGN
jgi:hypothetical protein